MELSLGVGTLTAPQVFERSWNAAVRAHTKRKILQVPEDLVAIQQQRHRQILVEFFTRNPGVTVTTAEQIVDEYILKQ